MQQTVAFPQAESSYEAIDSFAHGVTLAPELSKILRRRNSKISSAGLKDFEPFEMTTHARKRSLIANALKYLAKYQVG
jgi:hypothetical protein